MGNTSEMISEDYIKKSCSLSFEELSGELFHVDKSSDGVVFIVFKKVWTEAEWFSGEGAFGETKIDETMFPSMRSIGNEDVAIVNKSFLDRFRILYLNSMPHLPHATGAAILNPTSSPSRRRAIASNDPTIIF